MFIRPTSSQSIITIVFMAVIRIMVLLIIVIHVEHLQLLGANVSRPYKQS